MYVNKYIYAKEIIIILTIQSKNKTRKILYIKLVTKIKNGF